MSTNDEDTTWEEDFDAKLDRLLAIVANIEKRLATLTVKQAAAKSTVEPADDADLDSQYGDPIVQRKDPPRWKGDSFIGCNFSQCPPDYLDQMASFCAWKADKDEANEAKAKQEGDEEGAKKYGKYAWYARKDAARAAGWAKRIREGWKAPATQQGSFTDGDDSVPF